MLPNGFRINECDKCKYAKDTDRGYVILCLYVDDILIVGSNDEMCCPQGLYLLGGGHDCIKD